MALVISSTAVALIDELPLRGPALMGYEATVKRWVEFVFLDTLMHARPGGLSSHHLARSMHALVPELPLERHYGIIEEFVTEQMQRIGATPEPRTIQAASADPGSADHLVGVLQGLPLERQQLVFGQLLALERHEPVEGDVDPLAEMLLTLKPQEILRIVTTLHDKMSESEVA